MPDETFTSDKSTVYPGPTDGKKYPILLVLHGLAYVDMERMWLTAAECEPESPGGET
jgi:hypothetical protein